MAQRKSFSIDSYMKPHVETLMRSRLAEAKLRNEYPTFPIDELIKGLPLNFQRQKQTILQRTVSAIVEDLRPSVMGGPNTPSASPDINSSKIRKLNTGTKSAKKKEFNSDEDSDEAGDLGDAQGPNSMNGKLNSLYMSAGKSPKEFSFSKFAASLTPSVAPASAKVEKESPEVENVAGDHNVSEIERVDLTNESLEDVKTVVSSEPKAANSNVKKRLKYMSKLPKSESTGKLVSTGEHKVTYADVGGVDSILQDIRELIEWPMTHPEIYSHLGIEPPRGILLHGPPGCGKTLLAHAVAGELGVNFLKISAPEIVSGMSGESEAKVRQLFADAVAQAPCLIFLDEIDAITPKRENAQREMERRIVAQLLTCMDSLSNEYSLKNGFAPVLVIGATNRPDSLDSALRRAGRFDREISMTMPDESSRSQIIKTMTRTMRLDGEFNFNLIAKRTAGFVGADLAALIKEAAVIAVNRIFHQIIMFPDSIADPELSSGNVMQIESTIVDNSEKQLAARDLAQRQYISKILRNRTTALSEAELAPLCIIMQDFESAIPKVQPASKREGFATIPDVTWSDIGALEELREELDLIISQPIADPHAFESIGITVPAGVLLFGPPGCGKTLVAKAVANQCGASFISVKGPELLNKYVGESERGVRQVFQRARSSKPCIIFFDELDALCPRRGSGKGDGDSVSERVVNQLLTEMDGLEDRKMVFVIAATNRPDIIDPAMLRPGRLDKLLYVPLPAPSGRLSILTAHCRKVPIDEKTNLELVASDSRADNFSGADLSALVREASLEALRQAQHVQKEEKRVLMLQGCVAEANKVRVGKIQVMQSHFDLAFSKVLPSVSAAARKRYDQMHSALRKARSTFVSKPEELETDEPKANVIVSTPALGPVNSPQFTAVNSEKASTMKL